MTGRRNVRKTEKTELRKAMAMTYIEQYTAKHSYPPSRRDLQYGMAEGVSLDTVQRLVNEMVDEGLIQVTPGVARSIVITGSVMKQKNEGTL